MVNADALYNKDELHAPAWLNDDFLVKVLKNKEGNKPIKINKCVITPGTTKSDHYASIMFRAKINYTVESETQGLVQKYQSMIIKTMPTADGDKKDLLGETKVFETEIKMYTETLPKIESILRKYNDDTKLSAGILYYTLEPQKCIIFDDLVELGYATISGRFLTMPEVKNAISKVAKLHAVSYMLGKENDSAITSINHGIFNSINMEEAPHTKNSVQQFKKLCAQHDDLQQYIPHIEAIETELFAKCQSSFNAYINGQRDGILVLNHGDLHMKNMMLRHKEAKLDDLILLDYQTCVYGSAAIDFIYGYIMLLSPEQRRDNRDELIHFYVTQFQNTLKRIEFVEHIPTIAEFHQEFFKHKHFEIFMFMSWLMFSHVFADAKGDLTKAIEDETHRNSLLCSKDMLKEIRTLLPRLLHRGYFDN